MFTDRRSIAALLAAALVVAATTPSPALGQDPPGEDRPDPITRSVTVAPTRVDAADRSAGSRAPISSSWVMPRAILGTGPTAVSDVNGVQFDAGGRLVPDADAEGGNLGDPKPAGPDGAPLSPLLAETQTGFEGLSEAGIASRVGCPGGTPPSECIEPPDPWVAVGPGHVVQAVNTVIRFTTRTGVLAAPDVSLDDFFDAPADQVGIADPRVMYVDEQDRWLATAFSFDCTAGHLYLAVSTSTDPTAAWVVYTFDFAGSLPDYPGLGWSTDKVVLAVNEFASVSSGDSCTDGGYLGATAIVIDWADVLAGAVTTTTVEGPHGTVFTWRPVQGSVDGDAHLVGADPESGDVLYATVQGRNETASVTFGWRDLTDATLLDPFSDPPPPRQLGSAPHHVIERAVDFRPTDAIARGDRIWFVATAGCLFGDGTLRACVRISQITTEASGNPVETFYFYGYDIDLFMGGIGHAGDGTFHLVFHQSSPVQHVATWATYRRVGEPPQTWVRDARVVHNGNGTYLGDRWGDYTGVAADPADPTAVWQGAEYPTAAGGWATWVSRLRVTPIGTTGTVVRLAGADRYATAAAASAATFASGVKVVYVATGANFPDALAGGPAAALQDGPLLLVARDTIPAATATELARLKPERIVVLGGRAVVSDSVKTALVAYTVWKTAGSVSRAAGADRYATAAAVSATAFPKGVDAVVLATGANFPDALAGGPIAGLFDAPLLLVTRTSVPAATAAELARLRPSFILVLGGSAVVSDAVLAAVRPYTVSGDLGSVVRRAGLDRYATAAAASAWTYGSRVDVAYVATGANFPDALAGGPAAALEDGPLLLVTRDTIPTATATELARLQPRRIVVLGGSAVVSEAVKSALAGYVVP